MGLAPGHRLVERKARALLAAYAQAELAPGHVGVGLLYGKRGALVPCAGQLEPGFDLPPARQGLAPGHAGPQAGKLVVDAREAVAVGREPQRRVLAVGSVARQLYFVAQRVALGPGRGREQRQHGRQ